MEKAKARQKLLPVLPGQAALAIDYPEVKLAAEYYPFGSALVNWGCSEGVQCGTSVQTSLTPVVISNFINLVQKSTTQTELTPDCINVSRAATCVKVAMEGSATRGDGAYVNLSVTNTGMQQLTTEIAFLEQDYQKSLEVFVLKMDSVGTKVLDTVYTGAVEGIAGDTVAHQVSFFNDKAGNVFQVRYKKVSAGVTVMRWMKVSLQLVMETYVRNCVNEPGAGGYRYGFQAQEKDNEVYGIEGTSYTAEYWQYDSRLGRRWNVDPVDQVSISNYACFANNPIFFVDIKGDKIDPSKLIDGDKELYDNLISDWQKQAGLTLQYDNGYLTYAKDAKGKAIINKEGTYRAARKWIMKVIDRSNTVYLDAGERGEYSPAHLYYEHIDRISISKEEIESLSNSWMGEEKYRKNIMNAGIAGLHELIHYYYQISDAIQAYMVKIIRQPHGHQGQQLLWRVK